MTLKVRSYGDVLRVDVVGPTGVDQFGVDVTCDALSQPDERVLQPALNVLNRHIAQWPEHPVTCAQVRMLADG